MPNLPASALALLFLVAGCSATPPPTAGRAQNPANPAAAESPRRPYAPPQAAATPDVPRAAPGEHAHPAPAPGAESETVAYTCPMHPEVRSAEPGTCPKCGMTLVPVEKEPGTP